MARYTADYRSASKESYKKFCATHSSVKITFEEFKDIIYTYNSVFMTSVLETGAAIPLPHGLGKISINKKKTTSTFTDKNGTHIILPVNWPETKKQGKKIYFFNDHSEGYRFRWLWFKDASVGLKMKNIWQLKIAREWSTKLCEYVKNKETRYMNRYTEYLTGHKKNTR